MKFICPACKKIIIRDMRKVPDKYNLTKRGYKSYCMKTGKNVYLKPITKKVKK